MPGLLAIDTRPDYTDTEPFPSTAAKEKSSAIYIEDAQRIGQWRRSRSVDRSF